MELWVYDFASADSRHSPWAWPWAWKKYLFQFLWLLKMTITLKQLKGDLLVIRAVLVSLIIINYWLWIIPNKLPLKAYGPGIQGSRNIASDWYHDIGPIFSRSLRLEPGAWRPGSCHTDLLTYHQWSIKLFLSIFDWGNVNRTQDPLVNQTLHGNIEQQGCIQSCSLQPGCKVEWLGCHSPSPQSD